MDNSISYEVKSHDIVVTLTGIELDGKTSRVSGQVGEFTAKGDSGKSNEYWSFQSRRAEEVGLCSIRCVSRDYPSKVRFYSFVRLTLVKEDTSFVVSKYPKAPLPPRNVIIRRASSHVYIPIIKYGILTWMNHSLQVLRTVEVLLLL